MSDTLCMNCGLCCDGTFFGSVVIEAAESARLERVGLRVIRDEDGPTLAQPCIALRGRLCAVYTDRPSSCAKYECALRKSVTSGARNLEDATQTVATMHALIATIRTAFAVTASTSIWETILALEEPATGEGRAAALRDYGAAIAAVGELLDLGRAHFEPNFAGGARRGAPAAVPQGPTRDQHD